MIPGRAPAWWPGQALVLRIEPPAASRLAWWPANDPSRLRALTGAARIRLPWGATRALKWLSPATFARESDPFQPASELAGEGGGMPRSVR